MILNESLFEDVDMNEYLQYDNKRDEDEEFFDDEFLFDEEEQARIDKEAMDDINAHEAEFGADGWRAFGNFNSEEEFRKDVIKEDAEQSISPEDVTEKDLTSEDKTVEQNAYTNLLIDALNEEWATVQHYQEIINQLQEHDEYKDLIVVIEDIIKDEKNHVGNLQMIIDTISTKTLADIADGEQEAIDQLEGKEDKGE